jgi:hypothetical protein
MEAGAEAGAGAGEGAVTDDEGVSRSRWVNFLVKFSSSSS